MIDGLEKINVVLSVHEDKYVCTCTQRAYTQMSVFVNGCSHHNYSVMQKVGSKLVSRCVS